MSCFATIWENKGHGPLNGGCETGQWKSRQNKFRNQVCDSTHIYEIGWFPSLPSSSVSCQFLFFDMLVILKFHPAVLILNSSIFLLSFSFWQEGLLAWSSLKTDLLVVTADLEIPMTFGFPFVPILQMSKAFPLETLTGRANLQFPVIDHLLKTNDVVRT